MSVVFIADGHLKGSGDPGQAALVRFLDSLHADRLVVLGDLFDFWTASNSVAFRSYLPVLDALRRLRGRGTAIVYCEGNHDFSMGPFFTAELGANVLAGVGEMVLEGRRLLIGHGDTIAMTPGYRLWRGYLRSPLFRAMAAAATPAVVWSIAGMLSRKSRGSGGPGVNRAEQRQKEFARDRIGEGFDAVVLGHSHAPGVSALERGGRAGVYANPGSLTAQGTYLVLDSGGFSLRKWEER